MEQVEREIKLLNVDVNKIKTILEGKGIKQKGEYIQDIYTFDLPRVEELYIKYLSSLINDNDKRGLIKLINEIKPCFDQNDLNIIKNELGTDDFIAFINNKDSDYKKLLSVSLLKLMNEVNKNFSKWVRLRQTGDQTFITVKRVVKSKGKYKLDGFNELEFSVPSIEEGKQFLEDLGYFFERHQEKMRIAYDYKNTEIVIDKWPKLNPYVEVEGPTKKEIEEVVLMLGYELKDAVVINTDDLYKEIGIDIYSKEYSNLLFDDKEKIEVESYKYKKECKKMRVHHTLGPIYDSNSKVLILGSLPSIKSREANFYYAHPKNRFWKTLERVFNITIGDSVENKKEFLYKYHIALFDVIKECDISSSNDNSIENVIPNDFSYILNHSNIETIFTVGKKAYNLYNKYCYKEIGIPAIYLPSTSPANCKKGIEEKLYNEFTKIKDYL